MKHFHKEIIAITLVILGTGGIIGGILLYEKHLASHRNVIDLEARAVSTWSQKEIVAHKGQLTRIRIRNVDNVSHGFAIPELSIPETIIRAGHVEIIEFTPKWAGEFIFQCVVQCSRDKHQFMTGKLIVKE
jgi:heme/copper-type cytochrome/quinol oxidase subunit 2